MNLLNMMTDFIRNHLLTPANITENNSVPTRPSQTDFGEILTQAMDADTSKSDHNTALADHPFFPAGETNSSAPLSAMMDYNMGHVLQAYQETEPIQDKATGSAVSDSTFKADNRTSDQYDAYIKEASDKHHIDPNLIHSIIKMESNYNAATKSHAGAAGLMQLMPGTAESLGVSDSLDAKQNIDGGVRYFKNMLNEQNGDIQLALAAYNAGPGNVKKHGGIPPFQETEQYVDKVMDHYNTLST